MARALLELLPAKLRSLTLLVCFAMIILFVSTLLYCISWLSCKFLLCLQTLLRVWDCFLAFGHEAVFRFACGIIKAFENELLEINDPSQLLHALKNVPRLCLNKQQLVEVLHVGQATLPNLFVFVAVSLALTQMANTCKFAARTVLLPEEVFTPLSKLYAFYEILLCLVILWQKCPWAKLQKFLFLVRML